MKLYFSTGACSLHPQIALREAGLPFELARVDLRSHKVSADGSDFYAINPKGYVPVLQLDDGSYLTEGAVIVQYVADQRPEANLMPPPGTMARYRAQEWLNFIASEIHKAFGPLFGRTTDDAKDAARKRLAVRFDFVEKALQAHPYVTGPTFGVVDGYLFNMLDWTKYSGIDLAAWPALQAFEARVAARPTVQAAVLAEKG